MSERKSPHNIKSACVIARLLSTEGYTDHLANKVDSYWRNSAGLTERQKNKLERMKSEFSELMAGMTESQRMLVGKFIGLHKKMSFDTGLRVGLGAFAHREAKDVEAVDEEFVIGDAK